MNAVRRIDRALAWIEDIVIVLLCVVAFTLGVMQVVLRYVFNTGFHWNEAVFVTVTVTAVLVGGSRAVRDGIHARVELIGTLAPPRVLHLANLIAMIAALALSALYIVCGVIYVRFVHSLDIRNIDSGIPDAITYGVVPVTMTLFVIRYILKIVEWRGDPGAYSRLHDAPEGEG